VRWQAAVAISAARLLSRGWAAPGAPVLPKAVSAAPGTLSSHTRVGVARVNCGYCVGGRPAGHRDREVAV